VSRGPRARTDVENEQALADLATGRTTKRRSARRTAIVEETDEFEDEYEAPRVKSKPKTSAKWSDYGTGRWKCPSCKTWTRDPSGMRCMACQKRRLAV
jgi:hypothetical protein